MKSAGFIHLHNHSDYSLLDGMLKITDDKDNPSEFLKSLAARKVPALAITDHGNMFGAVEFYFAASEIGIRPIIGCEIYISGGAMTDHSSRKDTGHLTLLAKDYQGYQNLMLLVSKGYTEGFYYDPRIDKELLSRHHEGLIALSGCLKSHIARACSENRLDDAVKRACEYRDIMGKEDFYLELMDHGIPEEKTALANLLEVSKRTSIPVVATNDCHYVKKEDWLAHDVHMCISTGATLDDPKRLRIQTHELYFKSAEEMIKLFSHTPQSITRTIDIAEMCHVKIPTDKLLLPHFEVPDKLRGLDPETYLEKLCREGLKAKLAGEIPEEYESRLKFELSVIKRMGFASYFLIVRDFIEFARSRNVPVGPGRGSGAGSLVAYSLDITRVDPIVNGLLFERFLNPDRKTMPDLDIDFSDEGRAQVIEYVKEKYGSGNVAQIITFGTIKARSAIKDVGRVKGIPLPEVARLVKMIPPADVTIYKALHSVPEFRQAAQDPKVKELLELAQKLEGLKRHSSVHAAGTVITRAAVTKYTPLAVKNNVVTTQYSGEDLTRLGLLKIDFLGLRTLTVIENTAEMVRKNRDPGLDIQKIPLDDPKTFKLLRSAKSTGIFQLESEGMRRLIKNLKPTVFSDISALVALYRPGPMRSGMLETFVERKNGKKRIVYDHPLMEPILKDTYGTIVYQEQVMEIAKKLGGASPGQADGLRKAMGKKNPEEMEKARHKFTQGCRANNIPPRLATKIFDQMAQFAEYGFNKSHATAYALVAYQTAYLKAHYPLEFMTALLTSEIGRSPINVEGKENKLATYLEKTRKMGISILPPDVQASFRDFSIENSPQGKESIRFALSAIKNVGGEAVNSIVDARRAGAFKSLGDLCSRVDPGTVNRKALESLARAGALDRLYPGVRPEESRSRALSEIDRTLEIEVRLRNERERGQELLFGSGDNRTNGFLPAEDADIKPLAEHVLLQYEKDVLGFYFSGHPLGRYQKLLEMVASHSITTVLSGRTGPKVRLAGMIVHTRRMQTKKGEPMARFELEDLTGSINIMVFPKKFAKISGRIATNKTVVVMGRVKARIGEDSSQVEIFADDVMPLYEALSRWGKSLMLSFPKTGAMEDDQLAVLKNVLDSHPGRCPVCLKFDTPAHGTAIVETSKRVAITAELIKEVEKTLGERTWLIESVSL